MVDPVGDVEGFAVSGNGVLVIRGIKYSYAIEGADDDALTAKMKGGSNFGVLIPKRDKEKVNLEGSLEVEGDNGLAYSLGGGYLIRSKVNNYYLKLKMGFKF